MGFGHPVSPHLNSFYVSISPSSSPTVGAAVHVPSTRPPAIAVARQQGLRREREGTGARHQPMETRAVREAAEGAGASRGGQSGRRRSWSGRRRKAPKLVGEAGRGGTGTGREGCPRADLVKVVPVRQWQVATWGGARRPWSEGKKGERIEKKEWVIDDELEKNKDKKKYSHHL